MRNPNDLIPDALIFEDDPNLEHQRILQAKTREAMGGWELGSRLLRFKGNGEWRKVTVGGPYEHFTDYVQRGLGVSGGTAFRYMQAAELPLVVALRFGINNCAILSSIVEMTQAEETVEEAMNLMLPTDEGTLKSFAEMTFEERERSYQLLREELGVSRRGVPAPSTESQQARELRNRIRAAAAPILKPGQVKARRLGGHEVVDLKAVPLDKAYELFTALSAALKP